MKIANSAGKIFYGMHFCPGVAEYREPGKDPFRILVLENAIRKMNPTFPGRPVYVQHVDGVTHTERDLTDREADGFVIESFFNAADGKTWTKFLVVSKDAEESIAAGWKLSNAYVPSSYAPGGQWNGVDYAKEVTDGEFEHLAIVENPRYEESVILTPEQFKKYNNDKELELVRLANSKDSKEGDSKMKFGIFKKAKVENSKDLEGMMIELPTSKREISLEALVKNADDMAMAEGKEKMALGSDMVEVDGKKMSVDQLIAMMKADKPELENAGGEEHADIESMDNEEDESMENAEDDAAKKKAEELAAAKKNEEDEKAKKNSADKAEKKKNFEKLKNARENSSEEVAIVDLSSDKLARGRARYGS